MSRWKTVEDKFEDKTILTLNSPDRNLIMRFMNRPGFETEGTDWFSDVRDALRKW